MQKRLLQLTRRVTVLIFYAMIGRKGGQNGNTGGFAANPELARLAGAKGGRISRRGPVKKVTAIHVDGLSTTDEIIVNR